MIDRVLAEDLAAIFEVEVDEVPTDVSGLVEFLTNYINHYAEDEGVTFLSFRLQVVAERLHEMIGRMASQFDG